MGAGYASTTHYRSHENEDSSQAVGFSVVQADTCYGRDTPPVEAHNSATIACLYQEKPRALGLPSLGVICLFAVKDTCGPSTFQVW